MRLITLMFITFGLIVAAPLNAQPTNSVIEQSGSAPAIIARFNVEDTEISDLIGNSATKAVIDKYVPGLSAHPALDLIKQLTLKELQMAAPGVISDETLAAIETDLAKIPPCC